MRWYVVYKCIQYFPGDFLKVNLFSNYACHVKDSTELPRELSRGKVPWPQNCPWGTLELSCGKMSPMTKHAMCACLWEGEGGAGDKELYCVCPSFDESYFLLIYIKIIIIVINILITLIANDYPSLLFTFFPTCLHTKVIKNKKNQIVYPSS